MASRRLSSALATLRRNSGPSTSLASLWMLPVISIARHSSISTVSNLSYCSERRSFKERSKLITDTIRSPVITASEVASHRPKVLLGCRAAVKPQGVMPPPRVGPRHSKMPASEQRSCFSRSVASGRVLFQHGSVGYRNQAVGWQNAGGGAPRNSLGTDELGNHCFTIGLGHHLSRALANGRISCPLRIVIWRC